MQETNTPQLDEKTEMNLMMQKEILENKIKKRKAKRNKKLLVQASNSTSEHNSTSDAFVTVPGKHIEMGSAIASRQDNFANSTQSASQEVKTDSSMKSEPSPTNSSEILPKNETVKWTKVNSNELK